MYAPLNTHVLGRSPAARPLPVWQVQWAYYRDQARDRLGRHSNWLHSLKEELGRAIRTTGSGSGPARGPSAAAGPLGLVAPGAAVANPAAVTAATAAGPASAAGGGGGSFTLRAGDKAFTIRIEPVAGGPTRTGPGN